MKVLKLILFSSCLILFNNCSSEDQNNNNEQDLNDFMTCIPDNLQPKIVAYYPFTNGSLNDYSGNNQNLTNQTNALSTTDRNGNENCSFEFNYLSGTNNYLSSSNITSLNLLTNFSISLWYQPLQERDDSEYELLIGRGLDFQQWSLGLSDCRKAVFDWTSSVWDINIHPIYDCAYFHSNNSWHHLVAVFNSETNSTKLYRNGVLQETSNTIQNPGASHIGNLIIGYEYTGKIDDIIILNKSVNQTEVDSLFSMNTCCN